MNARWILGRILFFTALLGWSEQGTAQPSLLSRLDHADLHVSSLSVIDMLGAEVETLDPSAVVARREVVEARLSTGSAPPDVQATDDQLRSDFVTSMVRARQSRADRELTLRLGKEVVGYGTDLVGKGIESLPGTFGKIGGTFVSPLLQRGVGFYMDGLVQEALEEDEAEPPRLSRRLV